MTDLTSALDNVLRGHRDPFGTDKPTEATDDVFASGVDFAESTREFYAEQGRDYRRAREARDKEAAR